MASASSTWRRKKNRSTNYNNNYFSEEVILIILSYLTVKSLFRFRCVCKLWLSIISNSEFIQTHLTNSKKNPSILKLNFCVRESLYPQQPLILLNFTQDLLNLNLISNYYAHIEFVSSCNGILCLRDSYSGNICLLNPLTRLSNSLPRPTITPTSEIKDFLGFGFDCISHDYKIVRIVWWGYNYDRIQAELYSTNADSWRQIQLSNTLKTSLFGLHSGLKRCFLVKGLLYSEADGKIISFDLHNDVLELVPLPSLKPSENKSNVFDFKGSLACMSTSTVVGDGPVTSLWTLDDVCGKLFWTKKLTFELRFGIGCESLYLGDGKFVVYDSKRLTLYDYEKKISKELQRPSKHCGALVKYTESFISLEGFRSFNLSLPDSVTYADVVDSSY